MSLLDPTYVFVLLSYSIFREIVLHYVMAPGGNPLGSVHFLRGRGGLVGFGGGSPKKNKRP